MFSDHYETMLNSAYTIEKDKSRYKAKKNDSGKSTGGGNGGGSGGGGGGATGGGK